MHHRYREEKLEIPVNGEMVTGSHSIHWNGREESGNSAASGIHLYRLSTGDYSGSKRMPLLKQE